MKATNGSTTSTKNPQPSRKYREPLPVKLSDDEIAAIGRKLVACRDKREELDARKKRAVETIQTDMKVLDQEEQRYEEAIRSGCDERDVEVHEYELFDVDGGIVRVVRVDTSEVVRERPMGAEERQPGLPLGDLRDDEEYGDDELA